MSSPDLQPFVDLTLDDRDPGDLVDTALAAMATVIPGLTLREGFTESAVLEAQAAMDAEIIYAVNRLPFAVMEGVTNLFGVVRDAGSPPVATVLFTAADSVGHIIPAGTRLALQVGADDTDAVIFATDAPCQILAGGTVGTVTVTGVEFGSAGDGFNALPGDQTPLALIDSLAYIDSAVLVGAVSGGRDAEDDPTFYTRAAQRFARLSSALVTPAQFTAAALEQPYVYRCLALDNTAGSGTVGASPGHITLAILGPDGQYPTSANVAALLALLQSQAASMLTVHLIGPVVTVVGSGATVHLLPGADPVVVRQALSDAWFAYASPLTWPWAPTIRRNEVIALFSAVPGVDYVVDVQQTQDVTLPGPAPLPQAGSVSWSIV